MMRLARILRDYNEAGAVNSLIALWGFVDDHAFLTKSGHVGFVYNVRGTDAEGLTHEERKAIVHQFESALRLLDEHFRIYQYVIKQHVEPFVAPACLRPVAHEALARRTAYLNGRQSDLFRVDHFMVVIYENPAAARMSTSLSGILRSPRRAFRGWLSSTRHAKY
jgi:type IV secretion system protein VirB4